MCKSLPDVKIKNVTSAGETPMSRIASSVASISFSF